MSTLLNGEVTKPKLVKSQTEGAAGLRTKIKLIVYTKYVTCCIETIPDDFHIHSYIHLFAFLRWRLHKLWGWNKEGIYSCINNTEQNAYLQHYVCSLKSTVETENTAFHSQCILCLLNQQCCVESLWDERHNKLCWGRSKGRTCGNL